MWSKLERAVHIFLDRAKMRSSHLTSLKMGLFTVLSGLLGLLAYETGNTWLLAGLILLLMLCHGLYRAGAVRSGRKIGVVQCSLIAVFVMVAGLNSGSAKGSFSRRGSHWHWTEDRNSTDLSYSRSNVADVIDQLQLAPQSMPAVKPDILVILSESLWDVAPLGSHGVSFSEDPTPNLHALQREGAGLRFLSPSFAGGTANVEFELLTGMSTAFYPENTFPYLQPYFRKTQPSIVRYFSSLGYQTLAVHNNERTVWQRQHVYPRLGFDRYDAAETFEDAPRRGEFLADAALGDRIIQQLDGAKEPLFLFALTMQNHGQYAPDRYSSFDVNVSAPALTALQQANLLTYTQGLYDTDQMLGRVVEHLRQRSRPTVLVYFGDHLPAISKGYEVPQALGVVEGESSAADRLTLHGTPAIVWANYPLGLHYQQQTLSPGMVWPELLHAMGMEHPFYTRFLDQVRRQLPGISRGVCVDSAGVATIDPPQAAKVALSQYRLLQRDLLEGNRYAADRMLSVEEKRLLERPIRLPGGCVTPASVDAP